MNKTVYNQVTNLLGQRDKAKLTIALDWLAMYFFNCGFFAENYESGDVISIDEDFILIENGRATPHFANNFNLLYGGEKVANILVNSRAERFFAKDIVKVEFTNHTLYSGQWIEIYTLIHNLGLKFKSYSRIDVAIDGVGYLQKMMNLYAKQSIEDLTFRLKNSTVNRSRFSAKVLNTDTFLFENFNIGSHGGNKYVTIYNKSLEIAKSGKTYIQEYWLKNGMIDHLQDIKAQAAAIEVADKLGYDTYHLKGFENIYRFELRLSSEAIKEIADLKIEMLATPEGLASIVKTHCNNFFQGVFCDNENTTRATHFDFLPYDKFGAVIVEKIKRAETNDQYKAKLHLHKTIKEIYKGYVRLDNHEAHLEVFYSTLIRYKLFEYLVLKMDEWERDYELLTPPEKISERIQIISRINNEVGKYIGDVKAAAERNYNAVATAVTFCE